MPCWRWRPTPKPALPTGSPSCRTATRPAASPIAARRSPPRTGSPSPRRRSSRRSPGRRTVAFSEEAGAGFAEPLPETPTPAALAALARERREAGDAVVLCAEGPLPRLALRRLGGEPEPLACWQEATALGGGRIGQLALALTESFRLPGLSVLAGPAAALRGQGGADAAALFSDELRIGDLVVEPEHGLAQLAALTLLDESGPAREHLSLQFAGDTRLLVPAEAAGTLWRYGSGEAAARMDRLTGEAWRKRRAEVEAEIAAAAEALVARARAREATEAPVIVPPRAGFDRFTRRLPYPLTRDQDAAIRAVLDDLARGKPMNRLVCGDVGFGKTEVALHAAAAVALAGKQVAVVAPTTLLARQHFDVFRRRFAGMGIAVAAIIRSARSKESRETLRGLQDGTVRIVVGTQALAGPGVKLRRSRASSSSTRSSASARRTRTRSAAHARRRACAHHDGDAAAAQPAGRVRRPASR